MAPLTVKPLNGHFRGFVPEIRFVPICSRLFQNVVSSPVSVGGLLVMANWTPVVIGFGSTLAASILLMNTALGIYAYKMLARNEQAS